VGQELTERREQLQAALERRAQGILPVDVPLPKPENSSRASVSSIGSFSVVGTTKSLRPGLIEFGMSAAGRKTIVVALVLGGVAVAGAATALMLTDTPSPQEASPVPPTTAPSLGAPGVASVPAAVPSPPPAIDLDQLPTEGELSAGEIADAKAKERKRALTTGAKPKDSAAPKPSAPPKATWKSDPGF
jgi:hypothetical protein